jgi:hypothetical protein
VPEKRRKKTTFSDLEQPFGVLTAVGFLYQLLEISSSKIEEKTRLLYFPIQHWKDGATVKLIFLAYYSGPDGAGTEPTMHLFMVCM